MSVTLKALRLAAARQAGVAFDGTCSSAGSTTTLIDAALLDTGVDSSFLEGAWVYRPNAAATGDLVRRVAADGFTVASGTLTVDRAWTNAPAENEAYEVYPLLPPIDRPGVPYSWNRAVNDGLARCYFVDEIVLGRGGPDQRRRFPLRSSEVGIIATVAVAGGSGATITPPSGFTLIRRTNNSTDIALATYRKRGIESDAESFTFTLDSARAAAVALLAYADVNVSDPVDASDENTGASSTTATAPTVTSTVDDALILRVFASATASVMVPPADHVERVDALRTRPSATVALGAADAGQGSAGATGTAAATLGVAGIYAAQTIVLQPLDGSRPIAFIDSIAGDNGAALTANVKVGRPSSLPNDDWSPTRDAIRGVSLRYMNEDGNTWDADLKRDWRYVDDGVEPAIEVRYPPRAIDIVVAEVHRPYPSLSADTDTTECAQRRAEAAIRLALYERLNAAPTSAGQYKAELAEAEASFRRENAPHLPSNVVLGA